MRSRRGRPITKHGSSPSIEFDVWPRRVKAPARSSSAGTTLVPHGYAIDQGVEYKTSTDTQVVHAQRYVRGLRVYRSQLTLKASPHGLRFSAPAFDVPGDVRTRPRITATDAFEAAVAFLRKRGAVPNRRRVEVLREERFSDLTEMPTVLLAKRGLSESVRLHLEIFPMAGGKARLAWICDVAFESGLRCEIAVSADAPRPRVLFCTRASSCSTQFNARWIRFPGDSPIQQGFPLPPLATPDGTAGTASRWLDSAPTAAGPNVACHDGSRDESEPLTSIEATNVFVWCNLLHDFFAAFGFDAAHGAFEGDDRLNVNHFSGPVKQAAEFINDVDGRSPTMKLHGSPFDGAVAAQDPGIVIHEYTHGVSCRLLGGSKLKNPFFGRQARGLNEGYSDYFALTLLTFLDRTNTAISPVRRLREFGGAFQPPRIRDYRAFATGLNLGEPDEHELGMVWCAGLLDARDAVETALSIADQADRVMWQALIDSLKACTPICQAEGRLTFKHAKDALISAVEAMETLKPNLAKITQAIGTALTNRGI